MAIENEGKNVRNVACDRQRTSLRDPTRIYFHCLMRAWKKCQLFTKKDNHEELKVGKTIVFVSIYKTFEIEMLTG